MFLLTGNDAVRKPTMIGSGGSEERAASNSRVIFSLNGYHHYGKSAVVRVIPNVIT
jgi:hypothetical protein